MTRTKLQSNKQNDQFKRNEHCAFMSCAFPFHPPMKVANLAFISYNTYLLVWAAERVKNTKLNQTVTNAEKNNQNILNGRQCLNKR